MTKITSLDAESARLVKLTMVLSRYQYLTVGANRKSRRMMMKGCRMDRHHELSGAHAGMNGKIVELPCTGKMGWRPRASNVLA